jgi:hypothetical protein
MLAVMCALRQLLCAIILPCCCRYLTGKALSVVMAEIELEDAQTGNRTDSFYPIWARAEHRWYPSGRFAAYNQYVKENLPDLTVKYAPGVSWDMLQWQRGEKKGVGVYGVHYYRCLVHPWGSCEQMQGAWKRCLWLCATGYFVGFCTAPLLGVWRVPSCVVMSR